jgi:predicted aldo/keto reductase-like oxidoreductase
MACWKKYARHTGDDIPKSMLADQCTKCRECEDKCPQHLPICDLLEDVDRVLAQAMPYPG